MNVEKPPLVWAKSHSYVVPSCFTRQVKTRSSLWPKKITRRPAVLSSWRKIWTTRTRSDAWTTDFSLHCVWTFNLLVVLFTGLILPSGEINWNCPCLGGMASGPCGTEFTEAISCFHHSKEEAKGSDCVDQFRAMQECMQLYPELYPQDQAATQIQSSEVEQDSQDSIVTHSVSNVESLE